MPVNPIKMKDALDRFYTKDAVAKACIDKLYPFCNEDDLFIEPSAGGGSFFRQLPPNKIGLDLSPATEGVILHDWLTYPVPQDSVVVGNPPFGTRNVLTKAFIKHSLEAAKVIAFVLPCVYRKETMQAVFPQDWLLAFSDELPENSFLLDGEDYHVPCVFQIWLKKSVYEGLTDIRESSKVKITTEAFTFCKKDEADFFVFGASPSKIIEKELVLPNNRGYYIKQKAEGLKEDFSRIDWKARANSSVSGGVAWYSKQEIINIYEGFRNEHQHHC